MVAEQKRIGNENRSGERDKVEAQIRIPQQRGAVGCPSVEVGGRRAGLDAAYGTRTAPQGGRDVQPPEDAEAADGEEKQKGRRSQKGNQETWSSSFSRNPAKDEKLILEMIAKHL